MRYAIPATFLAVVIATAGPSPQPPPARGTMLFQESFDNARLASRGWYDDTTSLLSATEHIPNSGSSIEFKFNKGSTKPTAGSVLRRKFRATDSVYLSYYVKYGNTWVGSQHPYHPHEFHFLTTLDADWSGLSFTHLTVYVEQNGGSPLIAIQDGANVDQGRIGQNLAAVTERRAAAGCNGASDGYPDNCYRAGDSHVNEKKWKAPRRLTKNEWHFVEAYFRLNSIAGGKALNDGVIQYWLDGQSVIDHQNVLLRTGANPTMQFNQFIIAPYIGDGSPVAQSMWLDDLTVATGRLR